MKKPRVTARFERSRGRSILDYHGTYKVKIDGKEVATVQHCRDPFSDEKARKAGYWIFYGSVELAGKTLASKNSSHTREDWPTAELARDACIAWIKGVIDEHRNQGKTGGRGARRVPGDGS